MCVYAYVRPKHFAIVACGCEGVFTHMYAYLLVDIGNVRVMEGLCEMQPLLAKAVLKGGVRLQALTILGADDVQNHLLCSSRQRN